jgi:RimJ/RimL family protein N-acetyltransferase
MWGHPDVTRHIGGRPSTPEEVWSRVLRYAGLWALLGYGYWVLRERETGRFVGEVGLADFRRALDPPADGTPELGCALAPWALGRGFATEAVRAALAWGDAHLRPTRYMCLITPATAPSTRVAVKCGFRDARSAAYKGAETLVFERAGPALGSVAGRVVV